MQPPSTPCGLVQTKVTWNWVDEVGIGRRRPDFFQSGCEMDRCVRAAATMPGDDRKDVAVQALARSVTVSDLSARHGASRKFVYQQADKARHALDGVFRDAATDNIQEGRNALPVLRAILGLVAAIAGRAQTRSPRWHNGRAISRPCPACA
jgi:hypothetical protein